MTLLGNAVRNLVPAQAAALAGSIGLQRGSSVWPGNNYLTYAREGYARNEIVFAAVELLATSSAEPHIIGRRWRRNRRTVRQGIGAWDGSPVGREGAQRQVWDERRRLKAAGVVDRPGAWRASAVMVHNGFYEETPDHPLVLLLNNPNPIMSRGQLWSTVSMDRDLGGNAYLLKARWDSGPLRGAVAELWRLRPDRVKVLPGENGARRYEYRVGQETLTFEQRDIVHIRTRNPFDEYYGMPPLLPVMGRVSIDNYMGRFLRAFYEKGGAGPGAILSTKNKISDLDKKSIRERLSYQLRGPEAVAETLVLDNAEGTTYAQLGLNRGLRDALPKEIDAMNEARISMGFGIPGSILGLLIGYETSSYANQRESRQTLWDVTMTPRLSDWDDALNLSLVPEFAGIDEVLFDLSDIHALQEDEDLMQDRARKNFTAGGWSLEEFRLATGKDPEPGPDETFYVPAANFPTPYESLTEENTRRQSDDGRLMNEATIKALLPELTGEMPHRLGRPRLEDDSQARALWQEGERLRAKGLTVAQIAARLGIGESTYKRHRAVFGSLSEGD